MDCILSEVAMRAAWETDAIRSEASEEEAGF